MTHRADDVAGTTYGGPGTSTWKTVKYATPKVVTTTRKVKVPCLVCKESGVRHAGSVPFDCDACDGKGWYQTTENVTARYDGTGCADV